MVTTGTLQRSFDPTEPKPEVDGLLADVPGGEPGLLPEALTRADLKVWFSVPQLSDPNLNKETYELFVDEDSKAIATREWTAPIGESDRYLELPSQWLRNNDGRHRIYYKSTIFNGETGYSFDLMMTLDTSAPVLAADSKLIFHPDVLTPNEITAAYLDDPANQNQVLGTLPGYTAEHVGDVITAYWETSPGGQQVAVTKTLVQEDMGKPVQVVFPGALLRQNNGEFFASYRVKDRAGNGNDVLSDPEKLQVNIRPPTPRQHPTVKQATTTGATGVLTSFQGVSGITVIVPAAGVDPGELVKVDVIGQGGEAGPGSILGVEASVVDGKEFAIPASVVAANVPAAVADVRKVEVRYWAGADTQHSAIYTLTVNRFTGDSFGSVQCDKAQTGSPATLSKATVASSGANIQIDKWAYHVDSLLINVWAKASSVDTHFLTLAPTPLVGSKFTTPLPKDYVASLPLNSQFTLYAEVSLDQGFSFHPFKPMPIKVIE